VDRPQVCDAWPVRRQTYGYLPSRRASPPLGRYQIMPGFHHSVAVLPLPFRRSAVVKFRFSVKIT